MKDQKQIENAMLLVFKMKEGTMSQRMQVACQS